MAGESDAAGAEATAAALMGLPTSWTALHDVVWPRQQYADVDHVVVGPPGVFVIETKSWLGRVSDRDRTSAINAAVAAAVAVSELVPSVRFDYVHAVLCFRGHRGDADWVDGVLVCSPAQLVEELTSYVEVIPGGVGKAVAAEIQRLLKTKPGPRPVSVPGMPAPAHGFAQRVESARQQTAPSRTPMSFASVARLVAVTALGITLISQPRLVTSVSGEIADLAGYMVEQVSPDDTEPDRIPNQKNRNKQKKQQQGQSSGQSSGQS